MPAAVKCCVERVLPLPLFFFLPHARTHVPSRSRARTRKPRQSTAQEPPTVPVLACAPCLAPLLLRWTIAQRTPGAQPFIASDPSGKCSF